MWSPTSFPSTSLILIAPPTRGTATAWNFCGPLKSESFTCARLADTTVRCWGYNGNGQLGDGTLTQRLTPVAVSGLSGVTQLAAGLYHVCAVKNDGTIWCWGYNFYGQIGDATGTQPGDQLAVTTV